MKRSYSLSGDVYVSYSLSDDEDLIEESEASGDFRGLSEEYSLVDEESSFPIEESYEAYESYSNSISSAELIPEYVTIPEPTYLPSYKSTTEPSYTSTTPTPKPSPEYYTGKLEDSGGVMPDDIVDEPSSTSFDSAIFSMPEELFPKALMAKEFKPSFWKGQFQTAKEVKTC